MLIGDRKWSFMARLAGERTAVLNRAVFVEPLPETNSFTSLGGLAQDTVVSLDLERNDNHAHSSDLME